MDLRISDFQILKVFEYAVVVSEKGVIKISSPALLLALEDISKLTSVPLSSQSIRAIFERYKLDVDEAMSFVGEILNIQKSDEKKYFEQLIIAHEWGQEFEDTLASELACTFDVATVNENLVERVTTPNAFIMVIPKSYVGSEFKDMYFEVAARFPGSAICVALRMNDSFYISPPFISEIGNPCHFCTLEKIIYTEQVRPTKNNGSSLLKFCTETQLNLPEQPLSRLQFALVTGLIAEKIKLWTLPGYGHRSQDRIVLASYVNLFSGLITEEHISHWPMCDCLRSLK